ncbi:MAG TPA: porin [Acetobacteraceae bacterium]|nr:porin [Acetobacteraceae bacterium]
MLVATGAAAAPAAAQSTPPPALEAQSPVPYSVRVPPPPPPTATPDGLKWSDTGVTLSLADGNFTIAPAVRLDLDEVSFFDQNRPGGFVSGTNFRRERLGVKGTFLKQFEYNFIWEFGARPAQANTLYLLDIVWNPLPWGSVHVGVFPPLHIPEFAESSYDLMFMERAAISNIAASVATGDYREAIGVETRGERWNASLYATAGLVNTRNSGRQRGVAGRATYMVWDQPGAQLQVGFDGAAQFNPGLRNQPDQISFSDFPELRGATGLKFLNTGNILTDRAYAIGPEILGRAGPVYFEAFYQHLGVDVTRDRNRNFDGWYVLAAVPVLGPPREHLVTSATWRRPIPDGWINPAAGNWGAIEVAGRYSTVNLNDAPTQGGRQSIWTFGANWYLSPALKIVANFETGSVHLNTGNRDFKGWGLRLALNL